MHVGQQKRLAASSALRRKRAERKMVTSAVRATHLVSSMSFIRSTKQRIEDKNNILNKIL